MTTRKDIQGWLERGFEGDYSHMIVVCDTFEYSDFPVYVSKEENVREVYEKHHGPNMEKVMEVYSYNKDLEEQLNERRVFNFD